MLFFKSIKTKVDCLLLKKSEQETSRKHFQSQIYNVFLVWSESEMYIQWIKHDHNNAWIVSSTWHSRCQTSRGQDTILIIHLSFNLLLLHLQSSAVFWSALRWADLLADRPDEIVSRAGSLGEGKKKKQQRSDRWRWLHNEYDVQAQGRREERGGGGGESKGRAGGEEWQAGRWKEGVYRGRGWKTMIRVWECRSWSGKDGQRWCGAFWFGFCLASRNPNNSTVVLPFCPDEACISHFLSLHALSAVPISLNILNVTCCWRSPLISSTDLSWCEIRGPRCVAKSRNVYITEASLLRGVVTAASLHRFMQKCCKSGFYYTEQRQVNFRLIYIYNTLWRRYSSWLHTTTLHNQIPHFLYWMDSTMDGYAFGRKKQEGQARQHSHMELP